MSADGTPALEAPGGLTRDQHIGACIGCQALRAVNPETGAGLDLTCYEMADRARYASIQIAKRLDYVDLYALDEASGGRGINLYLLVDAVLRLLPDVIETDLLTAEERAARRRED